MTGLIDILGIFFYLFFFLKGNCSFFGKSPAILRFAKDELIFSVLLHLRRSNITYIKVKRELQKKQTRKDSFPKKVLLANLKFYELYSSQPAGGDPNLLSISLVPVNVFYCF